MSGVLSYRTYHSLAINASEPGSVKLRGGINPWSGLRMSVHTSDEPLTSQ